MTEVEPKFSPDIYARSGEFTVRCMRSVESSIESARAGLEKTQQRFDPKKHTSGVKLLNSYVDAIFCASLSKYYILHISMIRAVNAYDFLSYALAGRSFIEVTATIRYYLHEKIVPITGRCIASGTTSERDIGELVEHCDALLRGGRFDWLRYFEEGLASLAHPSSPLSMPTQVNTGKCIEKWGKAAPQVKGLYNLFCDMVHPNTGSTLCIASPKEDGLQFGIDKTPSSFGMTLFDRSFPPLQSIVGKEFGTLTKRVPALKIQPTA